MMYSRAKKGFTLVELLVVISIISLLSSIVLSAVNTARAKARDAQRVTQVLQIANAIALYMSDHGGSIPGGGGYSEPYYPSVALSDPGNWLASVLQPYIAPTNDPLWHSFPPANESFYYVIKPDAAWVTANGGWAYLSADCVGKYLVVARYIETSGNYRHDCTPTQPQVMIVEVKY